MTNSTPALELHAVSKSFPGVQALSDIDLVAYKGETLCLLGDNGAGKSTLIKILSGVYQPTRGEIRVNGQATSLPSPHQARTAGISTVHQYGGTVPLMTVARNFFLGAEPTRGWGPFRRFDSRLANTVAVEKIQGMGIRRVRDGRQLVGTLSGGERQALAIARAMHFGAEVLILDEPTSALGVKEAGETLRLILRAKQQGVAVIFITHNAQHAMTVGDRFTVLIQGKVADAFRRGERTKTDLLNLMAGGEKFEELEDELLDDEGEAGETRS
jgi:simple sugar transport system ATP-binding protein